MLLYKMWSHVSQAGVGEIPFHHQVMSDDIDDIQDPRYNMSRRAFSSGRMTKRGTPAPKG